MKFSTFILLQAVNNSSVNKQNRKIKFADGK